jgi:hypothetical protein
MSTTMELLTGRTLGTVTVGNISLSGNNRRYEVRCIKPGCNSSWIEPHQSIMNRLNAGLTTLDCRNRNCVIGLVRPPPIEQPEPELAQPKPLVRQPNKPAPPIKVSPEWQTYYRHCLKYRWQQQLTSAEYEALSPRGKAFLADGIAKDIERQRERDSPGTRGDS